MNDSGFLSSPSVVTAEMSQGENLSNSQDLQLSEKMSSKRLKTEKCLLSEKLILTAESLSLWLIGNVHKCGFYVLLYFMFHSYKRKGFIDDDSLHLRLMLSQESFHYRMSITVVLYSGQYSTS